MPRGSWVFDPDSGGVKITDPVKRRTEARIRQVAEAEFAGRYTRLDIRFRQNVTFVLLVALRGSRKPTILPVL